MSSLVLGPLLRYADATTATVWVEASGPAQVEVAGRTARTVEVAGHHYGLVVVEGLAPGSDEPYAVRLDGRLVWPAPDDPRPAPRLRTLRRGGAVTVAFGSCRITPQDGDGLGADALEALALALQAGERPLPDVLLLLGDQVYADHRLPPEVQARQRARHGQAHDALTDLEEHTWLYQHAWSQPEVRWLLATVPSVMVWDDHEVSDGFRSTAAWLREHEAQPGWRDRVRGAYAAYWLYQHLGNLPPEQARAQLEQAREDGGRALLHLPDVPPEQALWGVARDLGPARLLVVDDRGARVLDEREPRVLGDAQWQALERELTGGVEHVLVATSLPVLLQPAVDDLERADEALRRGRWGRRAAAAAERFRHGNGLDHWAAFPRDWARLVGRVVQVAAGRHGRPPSTVLLLAGDVHYSYVARLRLPPGVRTRVVQVVSSPLHNALPGLLRLGFRLAETPLGRGVGRLLGAVTGQPRRDPAWALTHGPLHGNGLGLLRLDGPAAELVLLRAPSGGGLREVVRERLDR